VISELRVNTNASRASTNCAEVLTPLEKAIHRAYGARSRGELLGKLLGKLGSEAPRTRLLAELP
jgi:hypothetical protein